MFVFIRHRKVQVQFCHLMQFNAISGLNKEAENQAHCGSRLAVGSDPIRFKGLIHAIKLDLYPGILVECLADERISTQFLDLLVEKPQALQCVFPISGLC
jgi:hypothetical protein